MVITCVVLAIVVGLAMALLLHWASVVSGDTHRSFRKAFGIAARRIHSFCSGSRRGLRMSLSLRHMKPTKEVVGGSASDLAE